MGAVGGLLVSSADNAIASSLFMLVAIAGISVSFVITESRWTLPAAGFEWGSIQWTAFGIATCTLFALSLFYPLSATLSPEFYAGLGVAVFLIMAAASALPTRTEVAA